MQFLSVDQRCWEQGKGYRAALEGRREGGLESGKVDRGDGEKKKVRGMSFQKKKSHGRH